jgi:hypothetical protein
MFEVSTFAGVEKIEEASVFTVEKMADVVEEASAATGFEELGENTDGAGDVKRFPAGLKGEDAEEPKREELAVAVPPNTEPPTGLEAPPKIELLVEPELLGVKENAALGATA